MLTNTFANLNQMQNLRHAVFTRSGGVSGAPFNSLNLAVSTGDSAVNVSANLNKLRDFMGAYRLVSLKQCHSDRIVKVDAFNCEALSVTEPKLEADALVTNLVNIALLVKVADCQPVLLADPVQNVIAAVHSGWRGSVQNIIGKTVNFMAVEFGCNPANILAAVGPSLGPCCAEFVNYQQELPPAFWPYQVSENHFNFWRISAMQLKEAGVAENNIEISGLCTVCNANLFFSYRRAKRTGRFGAAIMLLESC